ncbi:hypothetical protein [Pseudomonas costantinii]|uniref:hypothetical protein n=1 Tax=Pseudomonas costantinii TaxID=168469 RepID=UPI0015A1D20B|nr:hypothetical protein [Pseudomonas costantinii]NVZ73234.1 hypothetical protein [Pseudomonas costantinii]
MSLAIITSSLGGCATAPARPTVVGPEVYGFTLYQKMTGEQFDSLTRIHKSYDGALELYLKASPDGGVLGLYADSSWWLDTVSKTSKLYFTEPECQVAQRADEAQLKAVVDGFNTQQSGDFSAVQTVDACKRFTGQGLEREAYRYTLWATLQSKTLTPGQGYTRKPEVVRAGVLDWVVLAAAIPLYVVLVVVTKGQALPSSCSYDASVPGNQKKCDKEREEKLAKAAETERLEKGY